MRIVVELNQTDPAESPTPGCAHHAGRIRRTYQNLASAHAAGVERLGKPPRPNEFSPCCDWQRPDTIITSYHLTDADDDNADYGGGSLDSTPDEATVV